MLLLLVQVQQFENPQPGLTWSKLFNYLVGILRINLELGLKDSSASASISQ